MKKDLFILAIIAAILIFISGGVKIQSVDDYYLTHIDDITEDSQTVFLSIDCLTLLDNLDDLDPALRDEKYVPSDGVILAVTEYVLRPNDTVFSVLDRAVRHNRIKMECIYNKSYNSAYVQGLNHIYEFSAGPLSGWMYRVNGQYPGYGGSGYKLKDGDVIEWKYTLDLGRDIGGYSGGFFNGYGR
ncbi:MAG: DUF4430 domain-containing protein [Clostridiales bacterium]|jgi:hypothetical protein|nr:DUF4430 domain-containing protein [Clostridiales bacterium]